MGLTGDPGFQAALFRKQGGRSFFRNFQDQTTEVFLQGLKTQREPIFELTFGFGDKRVWRENSRGWR